MSMFHELMMRKKEQIMYATIKGTLTENDGVFSGFSTSNYLEVQGLYDFSQPFEIKTKIHLNSNPSASSFISIKGDVGYVVILIGSTRAIGVYMDANDGTSLSNGNVTPNYTIPTNTDVFLKFVFTGTEYALYISTDDSNYTKYLVATSSKVIGNNNTIILGANPPSQSFSTGSIDLNQSYIKLGSTKYNLQAVVGYTVVGSPTITDGVVSGFSASDYLRLQGFEINTDYEIGTKIIVNNLESAIRNIIGSQFVYSKYGFTISTNNKPYSSIRYELNGTYTNITSLIDLVLQPNTIYYLKAILKNNTYQAFLSTDKVNWIEGNIANVPEGATIVSPNTFQNQAGRLTFGGGTQYTTFDGSIYLNETYIKLNNKLWFNG